MPLYLPLVSLGWAALVGYLNRDAFKDFDGMLRKIAESRVRNGVI